MTLDRKNKYLILGFVAALYVSYTFAISNTIRYYKTYKANSEKLEANTFSDKTAFQLRHKEKQLDAALASFTSNSPETFQNELLRKLSDYSSGHNLKITDFKEPHLSESNGFLATSYAFTIQGSFNDCLALVNSIENTPGLGTVKHLNFVKKRDYKSNIDRLFAEVILQQNKGK